jgi:hypothetical protein
MWGKKKTNNQSDHHAGFHIHGHSQAAIIISALVIVAVVVAAVFTEGRHKDVPAVGRTPHYLLLQQKKAQLNLLDSNFGNLYQMATTSLYVNAEAGIPYGGALVSENAGQRFSLLNTKSSTLSADDTAVLGTAVKLGAPHNIYMTDTNTALYISCQSDQNCLLKRLDLATAKDQTIVDTGVKADSVFVPVYLLGVSPDFKFVFLRSEKPSNLGKDASAVYKIDLASHKQVGKTAVPAAASYNTVLSPDQKTLAYKTGGFGQELVIHFVDISTGKVTDVKWAKGEINNTPQALVWSPDSKNLLFEAKETIMMSTTAKDNPEKLVNVDVAKKTTTELQNFKDIFHHNVDVYGWADDSTAVYAVNDGNGPSDSNSTSQIYKLPLGSKNPVKAIAPTGQLVGIAYW